jgi:hypothetical protein
MQQKFDFLPNIVAIWLRFFRGGISCQFSVIGFIRKNKVQKYVL